MRGKIDGDGSNVDELQTATTHTTSNFDQILNDDVALLDFTVSLNMLLASVRLASWS